MLRFPFTHMDRQSGALDLQWELPVSSGRRDHVTNFEELITRLRSAHAKVCARNADLEHKMHRLHEDDCFQESTGTGATPTVIGLTTPRTPQTPPSAVARAKDLRAGWTEMDDQTLQEASVALEKVVAPRGSLMLKGATDMSRTRPQSPRSLSPEPPHCLAPYVADHAGINNILCKMAKQQEKFANEIKDIIAQGSRASRWNRQRRSSNQEHSNRLPTKTRSTFAVSIITAPEKEVANPHGSWMLGSWQELFSAELTGANWRTILQHLVNSSGFFYGSTFAILSYALFIAIETEMLASDPDQDYTEMKVVHGVYSFFFSVELVMRFVADGWGFVCDKGTFFNRLDTLLVLSVVGDIVLEIFSASISTVATASSVMRAARIVRVLRTMRIVRTLRYLHEFQKMIVALASSAHTLSCSVLLICFVIFFFAVVFTQGAADTEMRDTIQDLDKRYGSLPKTVYTLFLSVTNGMSWDGAFTPLHDAGWGFGYAFLLYIVILLFGVMNVVTSIFVESVMRSAQHHRELIVRDKENDKHIAMVHMQELFREADTDGSGHISADELRRLLSDQALRKYMEALDITSEDAHILFHLIDQDGSGQIDIEEFCEGCLRLKGNARSIDIHTLIFQTKNFLAKWAEFTDFVEYRFKQIEQVYAESY